MPNDLRRLLADELDSLAAPPLPDLAAGAVQRGRRLRRTRRLRVGAAALVACGLLIGVGVGLRPAPRSATPAPVAAAPSAAPSTAPSVARVPATSAGLLELLTRLLPAGQTSGFARAADDPLHVQVMIDRGQGKAMLRVSVFRHSTACPTTCRPIGGGAFAAVGEIPDNCIQRWMVTVYHANGDAVAFDLSSCLEWNGTTNPPSPRALSDAEAIAIGANSGFGTTMPADVVAAGAEHFATIRPMNGG